MQKFKTFTIYSYAEVIAAATKKDDGSIVFLGKVFPQDGHHKGNYEIPKELQSPSGGGSLLSSESFLFIHEDGTMFSSSKVPASPGSTYSFSVIAQLPDFREFIAAAIPEYKQHVDSNLGAPLLDFDTWNKIKDPYIKRRAGYCPTPDLILGRVLDIQLDSDSGNYQLTALLGPDFIEKAYSFGGQLFTDKGMVRVQHIVTLMKGNKLHCAALGLETIRPLSSEEQTK